MFDKLLEKMLKINLYEGFSELLHETPGIDAKARRVFYVALRSDLISAITDQPKDNIPELERMAGELDFYLSQVAEMSSDEKKIRDVQDYFERNKNDKGLIAAGYLKYLIIPEAINALKDEGLWNEETDEPIFPTKKYYE